MKLVKFIKSHNDWEDLLQREPYFLEIKRDNGFILFKYNTLASDFSNEIVQEARGVILKEDTMEVVCYPFTKFFNVGEPNVAEIDWDSAKVQEKIDGSLMKLWFCEGIWRISTNSNINAFNAPLYDQSMFKNFGELFVSIFDGDILPMLNKNYTYMFELVSPYNKVVIDYPKIKLYHIGTRDNKTEKELDIDIGIEKPKLYDLKTEEDTKLAASKLPFSEEGYVVVDKDYHRAKIKSPKYIHAHAIKNNGVITTKRILSMIINGDDKEFLAYYPEYKNDFSRVQRMYLKYKKHLAEAQKKIEDLSERILDRKEFAKELMEILPEDSDMGFALYDRKTTNWVEYLKGQIISKTIKELEKYE
jgi:hypothetical protein